MEGTAQYWSRNEDGGAWLERIDYEPCEQCEDDAFDEEDFDDDEDDELLSQHLKNEKP